MGKMGFAFVGLARWVLGEPEGIHTGSQGVSTEEYRMLREFTARY